MNDDLLVKFLLNETSEDENRLVHEWIDADPENRKQLADMQLIWNTSKNLSQKSNVVENEAWDRFKQRAKALKKEEMPVRSLWQRSVWMKVAAVFVLVTAAIAFFRIYTNTTDTLIAQERVTTETLPDGSELTLNKDSELSYSFPLGGKERRVDLKKGEVFFKVSANKDKPFVIQSGDVQILVVGTSFNVKRQHTQTEVIVETGIVNVSRGTESVELRKGERIVVSASGKLETVRNDDRLYNYYRTKQFVANNTPLWRLVEVLNEAYKAHIVIENPGIRNLTLTTTFREEPLANILKVISETLEIKVEQQGDTIVLSKR